MIDITAERVMLLTMCVQVRAAGLAVL
jgi:hypothetical protein